MYPLVKRAFDLVVALIALAMLAIPMLIIAVWIKLDSEGPVLYAGKRVGQDGVLFGMYKFRTMVVNADRIGGSSTPDDDPRLTRIGKKLRRYKLDELPQFINVLRGDMSLVGPRPQVPSVVEGYSDEERLVLTVPPGITDYASLRFPNEGEILRSAPDPDAAYMELIHPEKMRLAVHYVRTRSFGADLAILFRTALAIFK